MGRDRKPKNKLSRREGKDLFGTGGASLEKRLQQSPGMHGRRPTQRKSVYAEQLREDQFRRLVEMAQKSREQTGVALLKLLERRLDNIVYRLGFARTRPQARQFVTHGLVRVNGERVNIPSYLVQTGAVIQMKESGLQIPDVQELSEAGQPIPAWLERRDGGGVILREPNREAIDPDIQDQRIVEFYSR